MEFRELQYIVAIAKYMNISHAADELYVSQPTLSKCLQKIESSVGQPLFKRIGKRLLLTYAGEVFIAQARHILEMESTLEKSLQSIAQKDCGRLSVAFPIMRATYTLPEILPQFQQKYPNVQVKVYEAHSNDLDSILLRGDADIAFYNMQSRDSNLQYEVLYMEEIILVASSDSPLKERAISLPECHYPYLPLSAAKDQRIILTSKKQRTRQIVDAFLGQGGLELPNTMEISNILAGVQLAAKGYGVTLASESHIRHIHLPKDICLFSIAAPGIYSDFVAAFRRGAYRSIYAEEFINIVRQCYYTTVD